MPKDKKQIDEFRRAMQTLPSQKPEKNYKYVDTFDPSVGYVKLVDYPKNIFKPIVRAATATWGNADQGSTQKWEKLSPQARYIVSLAVLTGNTLPQAAEVISFQFEYNGFARSCFDQAARARIGATFQSIGSRDNSKLDAPFILYPELYKELQNNSQLKEKFEKWVKDTKDIYEEILSKDQSSWQEARAVLPMSYSHSWCASYNFLSLKGQMSNRLKCCEESHIVYMFWKMRQEIENVSPFLANYLRPACDTAKRCVYHGKHEGLTKYFSNLYSGCGRWKLESDSDYQEFNRSCSDPKEIEKYVKYIWPNQWVNYTENDYNLLSQIDKNMFEED